MQNFYVTETGEKFEILINQRIIDLSNKRIIEIQISNLPNCEWLYLSNNQLTNFNCDLPNCELLDLRNNQLTNFNCDLPNCEWLYLSNNQLTNFNCYLPNCQRLYLRNNQLTNFNCYLPNCQRLYLRNNQLTIFNCDLPNCEWLYLSNNQLTNFNCDLPNCELLDLRNNQLTSFDCDLPNCELLDLDENVTINNNIISVDGYCMKVFSKKTIEDYVVYNAEYNNSKKKCYIAKKDKFTAHGISIKEAIEDVKFKYLQENLNIDDLVKEIKSKNVMTVNDFRLLTGACQNGCEYFLSQNNIKVDNLPLYEALNLIENQYGWDKISQLFDVN